MKALILILLFAFPVFSEEYYLVKKSDVEWLAVNNDFASRAVCSRNIDIFVEKVTKTKVICPKCGTAVEKNAETFCVPETSPTWKFSVNDENLNTWRYLYLEYKGYITNKEYELLCNWWIEKKSGK